MMLSRSLQKPGEIITTKNQFHQCQRRSSALINPDILTAATKELDLSAFDCKKQEASEHQRIGNSSCESYFALKVWT